MYVEQAAPWSIAEISSLLNILQQGLDRTALPTEKKNEIIALVPENLRGAGAFLDAMTQLWRYEFGEPSELSATGFRLLRTDEQRGMYRDASDQSAKKCSPCPHLFCSDVYYHKLYVLV